MDYKEVISLLVYLAFYFSLLQLSSVAICGWYATTRGREIIEPDGTKKKTGKLLKAWYFFWFMERKSKKITPYLGNQLLDLVDKFKLTTGIPSLYVPEGSEQTFSAPTEFKNHVKSLQEQYGVDIKYYGTANGFDVKVAREEPDYYFAEWVRDMMAGCITCHASFYGSIIFWLLHFTVRNEVWYAVYDIFEYKNLSVFLTWILYTFSLAYLNTVKYRKF